MRILIVEDNPTERELLRYLLEGRFQHEAKFREASSLSMAFTYLEQRNIDCVVLDLSLPDSAGKETFEKINARYPDVPVIVMTHNKNRELALEMIKMGAADYILKDFTNEEDIFRRIVFAVEKHRHTIRMTPEKVETVKNLDRAQANMLTAHQSGEHRAIQTTTTEATTAVVEISRKMFTELQSISNEMAKNRFRDDLMAKTLETLETEVLKGTGTKQSMKTQLELLSHRLEQNEKRLAEFKSTSKEDEKLKQDIQHARLSDKTKVLLGILALVGAITTSAATYIAATQHSDPPQYPKAK